MKEVKKKFDELSQYKRKKLKDFNNVDNVINSISDIIEKKKREPLSKSIDCTSF